MYSYATPPLIKPVLKFFEPCIATTSRSASLVSTSGRVRKFPADYYASDFFHIIDCEKGINHLSQDYNGIIYSIIGDTLMTKRKEINIQKLQSFSELCENWNGYNASPIKERSIEAALKIVKSLRIQPQVFPVADGSVQLEFDYPNGNYLEIMIRDDDTVDYYAQFQNGREKEETIRYDLNEIKRMVDSFNE